MNTSTNVVRLRQPEEFEDPLTDILRSGARRLLAQAVELEAEAFLARMQDLKLPDGRDRLVRHGHGPERMIQTGIGPVAVSRVKIRDRGAASDDDRVRFSSSILPKWARRTRSLDALLPILYLRGVSTGDFQEALAALLGREAPNLSPSVIARLSGEWQAEYEHWQRRDLSARRYVYLWADGVYLQARRLGALSSDYPIGGCRPCLTSANFASAARMRVKIRSRSASAVLSSRTASSFAFECGWNRLRCSAQRSRSSRSTRLS
jgi:putative transposase